LYREDKAKAPGAKVPNKLGLATLSQELEANDEVLKDFKYFILCEFERTGVKLDSIPVDE